MGFSNVPGAVTGATLNRSNVSPVYSRQETFMKSSAMPGRRPLLPIAFYAKMVRNTLVTGHRSENCLSDCFLKTRTHTIDPILS